MTDKRGEVVRNNAEEAFPEQIKLTSNLNTKEGKYLFCKKKGIDPDLLSEEEKERLIDKVLHEAN